MSNEERNNVKKLKIADYVGTQSRWRSPVMWSSIATGLLTLLGEWGLYEAVGVKPELIQHTISFILSMFTAFGILNSPTNRGTLWVDYILTK